MKTASKFLSMLLLVALCLSLMGGSAYALAPLDDGGLMSLEPVDDFAAAGDPSAVGSGSSDTSLMTLEPMNEVDTYTSGIELNSLEVMPLTATGNIWNGLYPDLQTAAQNTTSIWLHDDAGATVQDAGGTINRPVTIDLKGKTLELTAPLAVNANIIIKNGTLNGTAMITVSKGYKVTFQDVTKDGEVNGEGSSDTAEAYVATIGSNKFATVGEAFQYASKQSGTVTINFINDTSSLQNLTIDAALPTAMSCSNLILNLNANCLDASTTSLDLYCPTTINGGEVLGNVVALSNVTLNNTKVGNVAVNGKTVTVNNSTVDEIGLLGGTLTMGSGSTVGNITIDDSSGGQSTLDVRGGYVNGLVVDSGTAKRAITGGQWDIGDDPATVNYLNAAVANGKTLNGTKSPYTVGNGSGTVVNPGGSSGSDGSFSYTVYGSPYTKNSNGSIYIDISDLSTNGYWIGTNANATNAKQLSAADYSLVSNGSGYRLTLSNSYLNRLSAGTYYGFVVYNGNTARMGSFVVNNSGSTIYPSGDVAVWPVNEYTWYSGDPMLAFYYKPAINEKGIAVDGWVVPGIDWADNHMGTLKLGTNVLNNLSRGWHTLTINTDSGSASCDFYIGATLKPVDTDKHVTGSSKNLQFVCTDPISRVWIGGNELTNSYYGDYFSLSSSRKTITLSAKFLNDRVAGRDYTITVLTDNGDQPSCTFQILTRAQASSSPRTGDESNLGLWAAVLLVSGAACVAVLPRLKKNEG